METTTVIGITAAIALGLAVGLIPALCILHKRIVALEFRIARIAEK